MQEEWERPNLCDDRKKGGLTAIFGKAELIGNIHVAFLVYASRGFDLGDGVLITLPGGTAVHLGISF